MSTWHIGDVTVTKVYETTLDHQDIFGHLGISDADLRPYKSWAAPFLGSNNEMLMSVHAFCIEADGQRLVVDTCIGNDRAYQSDVIASTFNGLHTDFLADLTSAGFGPAAVDTVVCTHLHQDHIGYNTVEVDGTWSPTFRNARYLLSSEDHDLWKAGFPEIPDFAADFALAYETSIAPLISNGVTDLVQPDGFQVSPSISLISTPGHTPGHFSVKIESQGETAIITGDTMHTPVQLVRPEWGYSFDMQGERSTQSRLALVQMAVDTNALVLGTHFPGQTAFHVRFDGRELHAD